MPKRSPARRERQKAKRELERQRLAAARAEYDRLQAIEAERVAEEQAPAAQRNAVTRPDGSVVRPALAVLDQVRGGYRRANPLVAMAANGHTITRRHLQAACRLKTDYERGIEGARSPRSATMRVDGNGTAEAEYPWLDAVTRYNRALGAIGRQLAGTVHAIAVEWRRVSEIAADLHLPEPVTVGLIRAGLDRLLEHYEPGASHPRLEAAPLPTPFSFDFAVSAIGEAVPAERLGMGRMRVARAAHQGA